MLGLIVQVLIVALVAVFCGWLVTRAWRSRRALVKWPGVLLAGLLTLIFALATVLGAVGTYKLYVPPYTDPVPNLKVAGTADQIARGQKLALICEGCHSSKGQLPLDGGQDFLAGTPFGHLAPTNLTPGGPLSSWSDGEIVRAIREGIHKDGRPLLIMPSDQFHNMSDDDVQAVAAYLRSQPAVPHDTGTNGFSVLGAAFVGAGVFPTSAQPPITQPIVAPPAGTAEHGRYLVDITGCRACHGTNLTGGSRSSFGGPPAGPDLRALVPKWTEAQFIQTIRTGVDPTGHALNPDQMPWKVISQAYSDAELRDIYLYVHGLSSTP